MSKIEVDTSMMTGDGGGYIPLSNNAIWHIFDYWADYVNEYGLSEAVEYYEGTMRKELYNAAAGKSTIYLSKGLHWDQFGYHFTGTIGKSSTTLHFYVEIYIGLSQSERLHVGSDFQVKETTTRWKIVTIADTYGYGGYNDRDRNRPPFPTNNSPNLKNHMPPKKAQSDVGMWTHDKFTG